MPYPGSADEYWFALAARATLGERAESPVWLGCRGVNRCGGSFPTARRVGVPTQRRALFAHMADHLARNGFLLPEFTSYNGDAIPFAHPPLGIYLTAVSASPSDRTRRAFSIGCRPGCRPPPSSPSTSWRPSCSGPGGAEWWRRQRAFMPCSYMWLIVGGGVTRALGLPFALLALHQGILMCKAWAGQCRRNRGVRRAHRPGPSPDGGLPDGKPTHAPRIAFHVFRGRTAASSGKAALAGFGGLLVASPWLFAVISMHGLPTTGRVPASSRRPTSPPTRGAGRMRRRRPATCIGRLP